MVREVRVRACCAQPAPPQHDLVWFGFVGNLVGLVFRFGLVQIDLVWFGISRVLWMLL